MPKSVHTDAQRAFCELMIAARKDAGLTQAALAERLGRPQSFIAKYEGGERRIDVVEFIAIAHAIGADPHDLFGRLLDSGPPGRSRRNRPLAPVPPR